jgi:hypothetical protein
LFLTPKRRHFHSTSPNVGFTKVTPRHGPTRLFAIVYNQPRGLAHNRTEANRPVIFLRSGDLSRPSSSRPEFSSPPYPDMWRAERRSDPPPPMVCGGSELGPWSSSPRRGGRVTVSRAPSQQSGPASPATGAVTPPSAPSSMPRTSTCASPPSSPPTSTGWTRRRARSRRRDTSPAPAATRCPAGTEGGCAAAQRGA